MVTAKQMAVLSTERPDGFRSTLVAIASQEGRSTAMRDDLGRSYLEDRQSIRAAHTTDPTEQNPGTKISDVLGTILRRS